MDHEAIEELLGAYALNAVEPRESVLIEAHVARCPECKAELEQHLEVAALLPAAARGGTLNGVNEVRTA